jgi:outer membrane protein OmpA-like peptidoglycan-associated protein
MLMAQQDAKGLSDHPVIGRFQGSVILGGETKNFDERVMQSGILGGNETALGEANSIRRSGKTSNLVYEAPKEASSMEIAENYRVRLQALGYKPVFAGNIGGNPDFGPVNRVVNLTLGQPAWGMWSFRSGYGKNPRYMLMEKSDDAGRSTAALVVGEAGAAGEAPRYALLVVDQAAMKTDQITVPKPKEMTDAFGTEGSISLYGIYFDTGSSTLKPESAPTLQAIADLMKEQTKLSLIVVGHTDDVGGFAANLELSRARAKAVVAALTSKHQVPSGRLLPFGAGMAAPAAPNTTDAGRAKNRRVELVPQ